MTKAAVKEHTASNTNKVLLDYVQRFELLNVTKENLSEDFKELARQAKGEGFDVATIKELVKVRKNEEKARERAQLLSTYASAIQIELF